VIKIINNNNNNMKELSVLNLSLIRGTFWGSLLFFLLFRSIILWSN
jgi:hypothetical protein